MFTWRDRHGRKRPRARLEVCLACGGPIEEALVHLGSLRCLECRETHKRLDATLVERWRRRGAHA